MFRLLRTAGNKRQEEMCRISGKISVQIPDLPDLRENDQGRGYFKRVDLLVRTLREVDRENQWRDPDPQPFFYIAGSLSNKPGEDDLFFMFFRPTDPLVTKGKIHAYRQYIRKLRKEMDRNLSRIIGCDSRMTLISSITVEDVD